MSISAVVVTNMPDVRFIPVYIVVQSKIIARIDVQYAAISNAVSGVMINNGNVNRITPVIPEMIIRRLLFIVVSLCCF